MSLLSITKKILKQEDKEKKPLKKKKSAKAEDTVSTSNTSILAGQIGLMPIMSEKSFNQQEKGQIAVFRVVPEASKGQIAAAVEDKYKAKVLAVRTLKVKPKNRRRGATVGKTSSWKKAYVTVDNLSAINTAP